MSTKLNLTGMRYGRLTVEREAPPHILPSGKKRTTWFCICDCGNSVIASTQSLVQGTTVSCGCYGKEARLNARKKKIEDALLGSQVGRWHVDSYAGQKTLKSRQTRSLWNCTCLCGTHAQLTTNQLTNGSLSCGCLRKELTSLRETIDLTGQKFGTLTVEKRIGTKYHGKNNESTPLWMCICDCGTRCEATSRSLLNGKKFSCGCKRRLDLTGENYGSLTVLEYCKEKKKWKCICLCGNIVYVTSGHLRHGDVSSCGCKSMSKPERIIYDYLKDNDVNFIKEFSFKELKGPNGGLLRFDFAILNAFNAPIALIEYQGEQHFEEIENFGVDQREITDFIKRLFCDQMKIPLYAINYDQNIIESCDKILSKINSTHANTVPSP